MKIRQEMKLSEYWREKFPSGSPTLRTLQRQCERGEIPAIRRGSWYVLVEDAEKVTGDNLMDMVLQ